MAAAPPIILTIAGFDPSSGAGVSADLKTIGAHDCYGVACITALTVQSTLGVRRVEPVASDLLAESMAELARDMRFSAIHVGMLGSADAAKSVADFLSENRPRNVVLDPILVSSSGKELLDESGLRVVIERLLPLCDVITPNLSESAALSGMTVETKAQMMGAASRLHEMGAKAVVVTGGHLETPGDLMSFGYQKNRGLEQKFLPNEHIESKATHGTGCAFSTSIACSLAFGRSLEESVRAAQAFVRSAIREAYPVGSGIGPMNHLYGIKS